MFYILFVKERYDDLFKKSLKKNAKVKIYKKINCSN